MNTANRTAVSAAEAKELRRKAPLVCGRCGCRQFRLAYKHPLAGQIATHRPRCRACGERL